MITVVVNGLINCVTSLFGPLITPIYLFILSLQATYYDDTRTGVLDGLINFVTGIFGKKEEEAESSDDSSPALVKSLKPTVSIAVLEEKVKQLQIPY